MSFDRCCRLDACSAWGSGVAEVFSHALLVEVGISLRRADALPMAVSPRQSCARAGGKDASCSTSPDSGFGFIMTEIYVLQRFGLFLGQPV